MCRSEKPEDVWARLVVGRWLRDWRLATGASQRTVARFSGVNQAHLSRVERGLRRPSGAPLGRIIIVLDWLSGGGDPGSPWAAMAQELPPRGVPRDGPRPPVVVGRQRLPPVDGYQRPAGWDD